VGYAQFDKAARCQLHKDDLMKPDLISEVILVGSGLILFLPVLAIVVELLKAIIGQY
jgi:hypothetical protein